MTEGRTRNESGDHARYSSDQREESIEGQLRECTAYCVKTTLPFCGHTLPGRPPRPTTARTQRMVKGRAKGLFDVVIVWKLDRFAGTATTAPIIRPASEVWRQVLSATENISEGPEGIILESMLEGMAEYYSR